ncbi:MAG: EamA family transporter [Planctomycetota bacterium]|nr:EamA family transporter [Planctomycetota bacterium]
MEFCEVASMSMELLGLPHMDEFYHGDELKRARQEFLAGIIEYFPFFAVVDQFQHWVYTHKGCTIEQREQKWLEINERFSAGVDWSGLEPYRRNAWQRIGHLFWVPFYYIEYAIAQIGALQVWLNSKQNGAKALQQYRDALALGGSKPLPELFKTAGGRFGMDADTIKPPDRRPGSRDRKHQLVRGMGVPTHAAAHHGALCCDVLCSSRTDEDIRATRAMSITPEQQAVRTRRIATGALLSVCVFWGATFLWMEQGTDALQRIHGEGNHAAVGAFFLFWRFVLAALLMPLLVPRSFKRLDRRACKWGFWLSAPFALGFLLQIFGLAQADVPPGQSAFLTSLYVVTTPLLAALVYRRLPPRGVMLGVVLAVIGAAFMKGPPEGGLSIGAWATIGCAVVFGAHILLTDHATRLADPMAITLVMFLCSIGWNGLAVLIAPGVPPCSSQGCWRRRSRTRPSFPPNCCAPSSPR